MAHIYQTIRTIPGAAVCTLTTAMDIVKSSHPRLLAGTIRVHMRIPYAESAKTNKVVLMPRRSGARVSCDRSTSMSEPYAWERMRRVVLIAVWHCMRFELLRPQQNGPGRVEMAWQRVEMRASAVTAVAGQP
jgi:hypothetical protein